MNGPVTFRIEQENEDPMFPLGIRLEGTIRSTDKNVNKNSFSIDVLLFTKTGKQVHKGKVTLLEGTDQWIDGDTSIKYYMANTMIENKIIRSLIYHYKSPKKESFWLTLLHT